MTHDPSTRDEGEGAGSSDGIFGSEAPELPPPPGAERRQQERRTLRTTAQVLLPGGQVFDVRTADISAGGMGIVAAANPQVGTSFRIRVSLPLRTQGNTPFETPVQVMHSVYGSAEGGFKIGLRFTRLDPTAASAIIQYLKQQIR